MFTPAHILSLLIIGLFIFWVVRKGRRESEPVAWKIALMLAWGTFLTQCIETIYRLWTNAYDPYVDLPLYLCDIITLILPFVIYYRQRKWVGILYFWALAGTFQALITPDVESPFPSFHYIRYFLTHGGIVATVLYVILVWKIRIKWQDFVNAILFAQLYLVLIHVFNQIFLSNYSYTMQKPAGATMLDYFGPWPWYLLGGEMLMILLFLALIVPFHRTAGEPSDPGGETFALGERD